MYKFYLDDILLPVTPSSLDLKISNQNSTFNLITGEEISVLNSAGLSTFSFEILLPAQEYPFCQYESGFKEPKYFLQKLKELKVNCKPFSFVVNRSRPNGDMLFGTEMLVSLESYTVKESADNGFDIDVSINLQKYVHYSTKESPVPIEVSSASTTTTETTVTATSPVINTTSVSELINAILNENGTSRPYTVPLVTIEGASSMVEYDASLNNSTSTTKTISFESSRETNNSPAPTNNSSNSSATTYTVVKGDSLWAIAKKFYNDGSKYTVIFNANRDKISNASLIFPNQVLTIPSI